MGSHPRGGGVEPPSRERNVHPEALRGLMRDLLASVGCSESAAAETTDALLEADLRGYPFEGCMHLPPLIRDLRAGRVNATARPRVLGERPGSALVDGDGGPAPVGGIFAADLTVRKARESGCCAVGLVNTDPLYMLGYFADRMARAGVVSVVASAGRPRVHPPGGIDRILGTNPLAIAIPSGTDTPLVVDFATSGLAFGAVLRSQRRGDGLPDGVAVDSEGRPTRDPTAAATGALTAFGEHKGFGLALCVGLLAGPLIGAAVGAAVERPPRSGRRTNRGTLLIGVDPASFGDVDEFRRAVGAHLGEIKQSRTVPGVSEIRIPGERGGSERLRRAREGVPVETSVLQELEELARESGLPYRPL
jgi:LDH2 family malate/lactate/ureidoglycolate dehydrogenase